MENFLYIEPEGAFFQKLNKQFGFNLDVYTDFEHRKAVLYFEEKDSPLSRDWKQDHLDETVVFCNPPKGRSYGAWAHKCLIQSILGVKVVGLFPASTDSNWFRDYIHKKAKVILLTGRLVKEDTGALERTPGMLVIWDKKTKAGYSVAEAQ